jgi:phasin family protein
MSWIAALEGASLPDNRNFKPSFLRTIAGYQKPRNGSKATAFACEGPHLCSGTRAGTRTHQSKTEVKEATKMANPRPEDRSTQNVDKSTQSIEEAVRRSTETTAEQTRRMGQTAAEAGEEVARAGANLAQQNAEALQNTMRFGLEMARAVMGRSTDQVSRTFGLSGNETQQAAERAVRNAETILQSTAAVGKGMSGISREYFEFVRYQMENSIDRMNELWRCRTPQDVAAVQSDIVRDSVERFLESSRRMADMSVKLTEDAAKHTKRMQSAA